MDFWKKNARGNEYELVQSNPSNGVRKSSWNFYEKRLKPGKACWGTRTGKKGMKKENGFAQDTKPGRKK